MSYCRHLAAILVTHSSIFFSEWIIFYFISDLFAPFWENFENFPSFLELLSLLCWQIAIILVNLLHFNFHSISLVLLWHFQSKCNYWTLKNGTNFFQKPCYYCKRKRAIEKIQTKYQQRVTHNHQWWYPCKDSHISLPFRLQQIYDTFLLIYHGMQYKNKNGRNIYY